MLLRRREAGPGVWGGVALMSLCPWLDSCSSPGFRTGNTRSLSPYDSTATSISTFLRWWKEHSCHGRCSVSHDGGGGLCGFCRYNMRHVFGRRKTKSIPGAAVNAISKTRARVVNKSWCHREIEGNFGIVTHATRRSL